jgi:hypothetical protein
VTLRVRVSDKERERVSDRERERVSDTERERVSDTERERDLPNFSGISFKWAVFEESQPPTTKMKSTVFESTMSVTASWRS